MDTAYRSIDTTPFLGSVPEGFAFPDAGTLPDLVWLPIDSLVIDPSYQRDIAKAGVKNVASIARHFDWNKFGTVIVARLANGKYAIVDGQHRTTAAKLRGIVSVPCQVITADAAKQAAAFADINGKVTLMTPLQIHAARVAARDVHAVALSETCARAGVTICRYPVPGNKMKIGETLAIGALTKAQASYGDAVLVLALRCITETSGGNVGLVRGSLVKAICSVLDAERGFGRHPARLIEAFQKFDFESKLNEAAVERHRRKSNIEVALAALIYAYLDVHLKDLAA